MAGSSGGRIAAVAAHPARHSARERARRPGEARPLLLEVWGEVLVEVVEEAEMNADLKIVIQGIGLPQSLVLRHDIAAVGHDVGGEDHPG